MKRNNADLFRGLQENFDQKQSRLCLKKIAQRMKNISKPKYSFSLGNFGIYQIAELYYELKSENFVKAYERLRYMNGFMDLCSSEITAILVPTIMFFTEDH